MRETSRNGREIEEWNLKNLNDGKKEREGGEELGDKGKVVRDRKMDET